MNKKKGRLFKRITATFLAVCMLAGIDLGQVHMESYAATELVNENLGDGAGEATAYKWNQSSSGNFDFRGLMAGYTAYDTNDSHTIKTTFSNQGYHTYIQIGGTDAGGSKVKYTATTNGGVQTIQSSTGNVELKIAVTPSPDEKYIFVDYYVYDVSGNGGEDGRTIYLGTGTDVMIGNDDGALIYKNERAFHMVNKTDKSAFDCVTTDDSLGVTTPDCRYIGRYRGWDTNIFKESTISVTNGEDSDLSYSWHFQLHPYETVHKRIAFAVRATSYYVSYNNGNNSNAGTYAAPFKTIEYAISKLAGKKGYIYIMDYPDISSPIAVSGTNLMDITIASTDYTMDGHPTNADDDYIKTLKRADGYTGSLFTVATSTLKFTDITLDGNGALSETPLLSASSGKIEINSGATVTDCKGSTPSNASAVAITGSANFAMNMGTITDNTSQGKGTVYFNSTGKFEVKNKTLITGNVNSSGKPSNVYLAKDKYITVTGDLDAANIGITTEELPAASVDGLTTKAAQELKVAVPASTYEAGQGACGFVDNFSADKQNEEVDVYVDAGAESLGNLSNTVLKRNGHSLARYFTDTSGGTVVGAPTDADLAYAGGDTVSVDAPGEISGYTFKGVTIEQGEGTSLTAVTDSTASDFGKVTGTMPNRDAEITYIYERLGASIAFDAKDGTPKPQTITGTAGGAVNAFLPKVTKYGYKFLGWSTVDDMENPDIIDDLPAVYPDGPITYYAVFKPDENVKFNCKVEYSNVNGTVVFNKSENEYAVETSVSAPVKNIHGYVWSSNYSFMTPSSYNYNQGQVSVPFGSFDASGNFTGSMPTQDASVKSAYRVDRSTNASKSPLTVKYVAVNGTRVYVDEVRNVFPEDAISVIPRDVYGYTLVSGSITKGASPSDADAVDNFVSAVTGEFASDYSFTGTMPNQPVEITYIYEATDEEYALNVVYTDTNAKDESNSVIETDVTNHKADTAISASPKEFYGYTFKGAEAKPLYTGSFDTNYSFSGTMPNERMYITYKYERVSSKWTNITYKAGKHGSLTTGSDTSADVKASGSVYNVAVLMDDGTTEGGAAAYTWQTILDKKLVPDGKANEAYIFEGWFIDQNGDGIRNNGEELLDAVTEFTSSTTITASFIADPDDTIEIKFAAGEHGAIAAGEDTTLNLPEDATWGDVIASLPAYTADAGYIADGWYDGDELMEESSSVVDGHTYTVKFVEGSEENIDALNYVIETINGEIVSVAGEDVDAERFEEAKKGDKVVLHAEDKDANDNPFKYWKVLIGSIPGSSSTITSKDIEFNMPAANVVVVAYYKKATSSNATVESEVKGGSSHEMVLNPTDVEDLEDELTTDDDRSLIENDKKDITYKIVYKKNDVTASESNAIKKSDAYEGDHEQAFHAEWGLNIDIERYIDGRKVDYTIPNNVTFTTYVQLDEDAIDMLDYQLFEISSAEGETLISEVALDGSSIDTNGLFTFTATAGARYVLVYSKAYRVYFINNKANPRYNVYFKVRKDEPVSDDEYEFDYGGIEEPEAEITGKDGALYTFVGWSYQESKLKSFDPDKEIKKTTYVYAYYDSNATDLDEARKQLEESIDKANTTANDKFMTDEETKELNEEIEKAIEVLERTDPSATLEELIEAKKTLDEAREKYDKLLEERYKKYNNGGSSGGSGGGGSSGGGGGAISGSVNTASTYTPQANVTYEVGKDGNWKYNTLTGRWSFVLNSEASLTSMWAKLNYTYEGTTNGGWYHFNSGGLMDYGWVIDESNNWYYCNPNNDGWQGKMVTGWHYDEADNKWYYLDPTTGQMATGWKEIDGKWYYFTAQNNAPTYTLDAASGRWIYNHNEGKPLGSMYSNESTPDGYNVDGDGTLK